MENPGFDTNFGTSIKVAGDRVAIGADGNENRGHAFIFDATTGEMQLDITDPVGIWGGTFGNTLALSTRVLAVPETQYQIDGLRYGKVWLFDPVSGEVRHELVEPDFGPEQGYGWGVAAEADFVAVASTVSSIPGPPSAGAIFLYDAESGVRLRTFTLADAVERDQLGERVEIGANLLLASRRDRSPADSDAVCVFDLTSCTIIKVLHTDDGSITGQFGRSIGVNETIIVVGDSSDDFPMTNAGAVHVFDVETLERIAKLRPPDPTSYLAFGRSVAANRGWLVVGATGNPYGAAYIYRRVLHEIGVEGECPGRMTLSIADATPNGEVAVVFGTHVDRHVLPPGAAFCAGTTMAIAPPYGPGSPVVVTTDAEGAARFNIHVPEKACGVLYVQTIDLSTCEVSNLLRVE